jgi:hypothetical protein
MVTSIKAGKFFDKIPHPFVINTFKKLGKERTFPIYLKLYTADL